MYDLPLRSAPEVARLGGAPFAIELAHNGGMGARSNKDGLSATAFPSGVWGSQVEISESVAPLIVKRRDLRPDSGGAGAFRGGLGQRIEVTSANEAPFTLFLSVERVKNAALGRNDGRPGAPGRIRIQDGRGVGPELPGKGEFRIEPGQTLIFETPGGGGYGDPRKRARAAVREDVANGLVSIEAARSDYGFDAEDDA